jgi:hypothetical protein
MNDRQSRDWIQILGQFGVIASLLFVGLQIKQDHEIALSSAYQARSELAAEFYWTIATDPAARAVMTKVRSGITELTPEEERAGYWIWSSGKEIVQNSYYQYQQGFLDEEHWQQIRRLVIPFFGHPASKQVMQNGNARESFQALLDELEAEYLAESGN